MTKDEAYKAWWHNEGSGIIPLPNEDMEEFAHRITQIAWSNGAFKEREECAEMIEDYDENWDWNIWDCAKTIRARGQGGHAFYCVACAKKLFGGYKESESFDRTASHMANEYVEYKEPILTDAEISESYYEVFKTAMIDIKAFEFAYSLLRKAQKK